MRAFPGGLSAVVVLVVLRLAATAADNCRLKSSSVVADDRALLSRPCAEAEPKATSIIGIGMSAREESVQIPSAGSSLLSARIRVQESPVVVIATHPWGPMGGSMDDPHPVTVCSAFARAGCTTARFNFRSGIGSGAGSVEDVKAVARWFTTPQDGHDRPLATQVLLVGYSYGSVIAAAAAADVPECIGYVVICPPLDYGWALYVMNAKNLRAKAADSEKKPKLLILGTEDEFCSMKSFDGFVEQLPEPKVVVKLEGHGHMSTFEVLPAILSKWVTDTYRLTRFEEFGNVGNGS